MLQKKESITIIVTRWVCKLLIVVRSLTVQVTDYVKNMVTGAAQMDGAILVVARLQMDQYKHDTFY
jgi:translation elongation factor EF-1alpha